jgi:hypothetical protein
MNASTRRILAGAALAALALAVSPAPRAQVRLAAAARGEPVERLMATAIDFGRRGRPGLDTVEIVIERWSTAAERERLHGVLAAGGPDKLLESLQALPPVGFVQRRSSTRLAWDLHYAYSTPLEGGGRRIVIATDRPLALSQRDPREGHDFMLVEIRVDAAGSGVGRLALSARIGFDQGSNTVVFDNDGQQPVRLTEVRSLLNPGTW